MNVKMLKDITIEAEIPFVGARDVKLCKGDELSVDRIMKHGEHADIILENWAVLLWVPVASFSQVS